MAKTPIAKEIQYIRNYIDLEKTRFGDRFELDFAIAGDIHESHIAPMLLLPFVENSFKHGVSTEIEGAWIKIDLAVKNNFLKLRVENSMGDDPRTRNHGEYADGIGLKNVRRRLELLYPQAFKLLTIKRDRSFLVLLKLKLD